MSTCSAESLLSVIVALHRAKVPGDQQPELSVHTQPLATRGEDHGGHHKMLVKRHDSQSVPA